MMKIIGVIFLAVFLALNASVAQADSSAKIKIIVLADDILLPHDKLAPEDTFAAQLTKSVQKEYHVNADIKIIGQDGGTTISSLPLIPAVLAEKPDLVIVALGYNDAMQRNNPDVIYNNLDNILRELERAGAYVLLLGVEAPIWIEHTYATKFNNIYPKISQRYRVIYHNRFLKDVQGNAQMTFEDRYHPTRIGIAKIVQNMLPSVGPVMRQVRILRFCNGDLEDRRCKIR